MDYKFVAHAYGMQKIGYLDYSTADGTYPVGVMRVRKLATSRGEQGTEDNPLILFDMRTRNINRLCHVCSNREVIYILFVDY